jgi:hypothetical protein
MSVELTVDNVSPRGTQTHKSNSTVREVVLIELPSEAVGSESITAPNPYTFSFGQELRATYFHSGKKTVAQIPRWSNEFNRKDEKAPLSDIVLSRSGELITIYKQSDDAAFCVEWDVLSDSWRKYVVDDVDEFDTFSSSLGEIIWSAVRRRETV